MRQEGPSEASTELVSVLCLRLPITHLAWHITVRAETVGSVPLQLERLLPLPALSIPGADLLGLLALPETG